MEELALLALTLWFWPLFHPIPLSALPSEQLSSIQQIHPLPAKNTQKRRGDDVDCCAVRPGVPFSLWSIFSSDTFQLPSSLLTLQHNTGVTVQGGTEDHSPCKIQGTRSFNREKMGLQSWNLWGFLKLQKHRQTHYCN